MREFPKTKRSYSNAERLIRVLMGLVAVTVVLLWTQQRPKFMLMQNARCVPLERSHLERSFVRSGACHSRREVQQIITNLVLDSSVVFDAFNLTYFLESGTLLGSVRNGSVLAHDQDADFGFDVKSLEFIRTHPIEFPDKYELHVLNSSIHPQGTRFDGLPARIVHKRSGIYIDIFEYIDTVDASGTKMTGPIPSNCYRSCKSCAYVWFRKRHFQVPYDWVYPLQSCPFGGRTLKCPAQPDKYLQFMFGEDYMTPEYDYVD